MEHLHTFLVVNSLGNITEASKILFIPQPTVSNRINYLEEELGQQLFKRSRRGVELTKEGEIFLPYAQQVIDTISTAKSILNKPSNGDQLKIGSTIPFTHPFIFKKVKEISAANKELNIDLLNVDQDFIIDKLFTKEIDTAFAVVPVYLKDIECRKIGREKIELILSPRHFLAKKNTPINLADLENENLICYKPYYEIISSYILANMNRKGRLVTNQIGVVKQLTSQNKGITFLPPFTAKNEIEQGDLVSIPINNYVDSIQYYFICRQNERFYEDILMTNTENKDLGADL